MCGVTQEVTVNYCNQAGDQVNCYQGLQRHLFCTNHALFQLARRLPSATEAIITKVVSTLKKFPLVAGAYLFGSALDMCRPDSDIDYII